MTHELLQGFTVSGDGSTFSVHRHKGLGVDIGGLPVPPQLRGNMAATAEDRQVALAVLGSAVEQVKRRDNGGPLVVGALTTFVGGLVSLALGSGSLSEHTLIYVCLLLVFLGLLFASGQSTKVGDDASRLEAIRALWLDYQPRVAPPAPPPAMDPDSASPSPELPSSDQRALPAADRSADGIQGIRGAHSGLVLPEPQD